MLVTALLLIALFAFVWFWQDNMKTKDIALAAGRKYCEERGFQLLDGTVALYSWRLKFEKKIVFMRMFRMTAYDSEHDKRLIIPIYMRNHQVLGVGSEGGKVIRFSDYR